MTATQPPPAPTWHREITDLLSIQQAEVFVLSGDTAGYPQFPGEGVPDYLRRQALAPIRRQLAADLKSKGKDWADWTQGQQDKALAALMVCCWIAPAAGLSFYTETDRAQFDKIVPPPEGYSFAVAGPAALPAEFGRLGKYFANPEAPPLCLIIQHADLIFSPDVPLNPQDTLLLSYLRLWSSKPLLTGSGAPHRIFLVAGPTTGSVKPDLFGGGRITAIKVPLPTEAQRTAFVSLLLQGAQEDNRPLQFEEGLTAPLLGRITGALNLLQVEDVVYRAELEGGTITRQAVQVRKDLLVKSAFGGVLTIDYPEDNWSDIIGYEPLKKYFQSYVYPLLIDVNPGCPKGCALTGPPGCLDAETPIHDPTDGSTKTVAQRWAEGKPFHVYALDHQTNRLTIAQAAAPWRYAPAKMYRITTERGRFFTVTGGHRLWTGRAYQTVSALAAQLQESGPVPLLSTGDTSLSAFPGDAPRSTQIPGDFPADHQQYHHFHDEQPQNPAETAPDAFPSPTGCAARTRFLSPPDAPGKAGKHTPPLAFPHPSTRDSAPLTVPQIVSIPARQPAVGQPAHGAYEFSAPAPWPTGSPSLDKPQPGAEVPPRPTDAAPTRALPGVGSTQGNDAALGPLPLRKLDTSRQSVSASGRPTPAATPLHLGEAAYSMPAPVPYLDPPSLDLPLELNQVDHITIIEPVEVKPYYDFHVPGYENYWACGFIHHNSGKTMLARCLAGALKLPLVTLQTDKLKNKFVGESNKNITRFLEGVLALAPCIVLIDEIEKILPTTDDNTGVSQEILGQLQTALSDLPGGMSFWVATTNFPDRIPAALLRPGRLEEVLPMLPAHLDGLRHIALPVVATKYRYTLDPEADLKKVGDAAKDYTGADLGKLLKSADQERQERGGQSISTADLETALGYIVPTIRKTGNMQDAALEYCSNRKYLPASLADRAGTPKPTDPPKPRRKVNKITDDEEDTTP